MPFFILLLVISNGLGNYIQNPIAFNVTVALIVIIVMGLVFKVTEGMGQILATGECRIDEQGRCIITMGRRVTYLSGVREIYASRRAVIGSRYVQMVVRSGDGGKVKIFGVPMKKGDPMYQDDVIRLFKYILTQYPDLRPVNNVYGEPIDYWYKR